MAAQSDTSSTEQSTRDEAGSIHFHLRDINAALVDAWKSRFPSSDYPNVSISCGDIFEGAPAADAIVSPANSFGFMDGGIDMVYSIFFGWQMQNRLQAVLRSELDGEVHVGQAVIIPTVLPGSDEEKKVLESGCNEGKVIKYLISAPTMRVPHDVSGTANAYLAFRAVIIAVRSHNNTVRSSGEGSLIQSVLCPGLGTAVGRMPLAQCAHQMGEAYNVCLKKNVRKVNFPQHLGEASSHHYELITTGEDDEVQLPKDPSPGEIFIPKTRYL